MPVTSLLQKDKPVDIADEIESFLHLIVYGAIRFVHSNLSQKDVHSFVGSYFDGYLYQETSERICGPAKRSVIVEGELIFGNDTIMFFTDASRNQVHPVSELISVLLQSCQSRFLVWRWQQEVAEAKTLMRPSLEDSSIVGDQMSIKAMKAAMRHAQVHYEDDDVDGDLGLEREGSTQALAPTQAQIADAEKMGKHAATRLFFVRMLDTLSWPEEGQDLTADKLLGYQPAKLQSLNGPDKAALRAAKTMEPVMPVILEDEVVDGGGNHVCATLE